MCLVKQIWVGKQAVWSVQVCQEPPGLWGATRPSSGRERQRLAVCSQEQMASRCQGSEEGSRGELGWLARQGRPRGSGVVGQTRAGRPLVWFCLSRAPAPPAAPLSTCVPVPGMLERQAQSCLPGLQAKVYVQFCGLVPRVQSVPCLRTTGALAPWGVVSRAGTGGQRSLTVERGERKTREEDRYEQEGKREQGCGGGEGIGHC